MTNLNLMLIGKTGYGKSATGNSILGQREFKSSPGVSSVTDEVTCGSAKIDDVIVKVVDGPGLDSDYVDKLSRDEKLADDLSTALSMCHGGVDAFLLVFKFGNRFTSEDRSILEYMEAIFGSDFLRHAIVIVTGGDLFDSVMEEEGLHINFQEWCTKQNGPLFELIDACERRCVLFNNREKDETKRLAQRKNVIDLADALRKIRGQYTSYSFRVAAEVRKRGMSKLNESVMPESLQQNISRLTVEVEHVYNDPSESRVKQMKQRIQELKDEIEDGDKGRHQAEDLWKLLDNWEQNLNDVASLDKISQQLENIRRAKLFYSLMGTSFTLAGGALGLLVPFVGAVVSVTSAVSTMGWCMQIGSKETEMEDRQREIQQQRLKSQGRLPEVKRQEHHKQLKDD